MLINFYYKTGKIIIPSFFLFLFLSIQFTTFAQTGTIKGSVLEKSTKEGLTGANVIIKGTSLGAAADINGNFFIQNVKPGDQKVDISYIGYISQSITVNVIADEVFELTVELEPEVIEGATVIVTAQARGQLQAINEQLSSDRIVNIVSSEKMKELPDANLAESIGRLPGISLGRTAGEADKVIIRGLDAKFNKVTIEGVPMVSSSGGIASGNGVPSGMAGSNYSDRSIDLSMIGDDLVKSVEVSKSLSANMDADAIGGTINLTLQEAPEGLNFSLQSNGGYNQLTESWKNYKLSANISNRFFDNVIGARLQVHAEDKSLPSQQFNAGYDGVSRRSSIVNGTAQLDLLRNTNSSRLTVDDLDRKRYGGSIILDYKSDFVNIILLNLYNQKNDHDERYDLNVNFQATGDGLFSKYYMMSDFKTEQRTHSLQTNFKIANTELKTSLSYTKGNYSNPGNGFPFIEVRTNNPFTANSYIYADPASLRTAAGAPDASKTYLRNLDKTNNFLNDNSYDAKIDYKFPFKLSDNFSGELLTGAKFREINRKNRGTSLYYNMEWGGSLARKKAFYDYLVANVNPAAAEYGTDPNRGVSGLTFIKNDYTPPEFLNGDYSLENWGYDLDLMNKVSNDWWNLHSSDYYVDGAQSYNSVYDESEKLNAAYFMGNFSIGRDLTIIPGIRWEQMRGTYGAYSVYTNNNNPDGLAGRNPTWRSINTTHVNFFPSVNIKYTGLENIQLMVSYFKSAARPDFSALSPLINYPVNGNLTASSNPFLKPSIAHSFDIGGSVFSNSIGLFSVNLYFKELQDLTYSIPGFMPFYRDSLLQGAPADMLDRLPGLQYFDSTWFAQVNKSSSTSLPINNPENAFVRGIEFSWQTHFWYLPEILNGLVLDVNVSFIDSKANYPFFDQVFDTIPRPGRPNLVILRGHEYKTRSGALINQPKAIYNVILGWDYLGFSSRVSLRYQQTTLTNQDSRYSLADAYYDNVLLVDVSLKQRIIQNMAVFLSLTNIGSHVDDYYYSSPRGKLSTSSQTYGLNAQFGISYNY